MARIEWVDRRLQNWARWSASMHGGGLGFASAAVFLTEAELRSEQGPSVPCDEIEAAATDRAVSSLKLGHGHLYRTLDLYYLKGYGIKRSAEVLHRAESTVHAHLAQADAYLSRWFSDHGQGHGTAREEWHGAMVPTLPTVSLLSPVEREALLGRLRAERAALRGRAVGEGHPLFVGPPRPPVRRNRPVLRLPTRRSLTP